MQHDRYLDLGGALGERFRAVKPVEAFVRRVIELAEVTEMPYAMNKPSLQPFFV